MNRGKLITILGAVVLIVGVVISVQSVVAVRLMATQKNGDAIITFVPLKKKAVRREEMEVLSPAPVPSVSVPATAPSSTSSVSMIPKKVLLDVPFAPQAPFGNWADERQDYGCEEASILMAVYWAEGKELSYAKAEEEIIAISEFEKKVYGNFYDTSAADTLKVLETYFGYVNARVQYDIHIVDIKAELAVGNVVIVPINGRLLGNPYFTPPGPPKHKLVIRGYDDATQEFITNDPGTKRGEAYRYSYEVMEGALVDYPSGRDEEIVNFHTAMIVVGK